MGGCVRKAFAALEKANVSGEVIVVDNGSTDDSAFEAKAAGARVVIETRRGYGSALRRGIAQSQGRYVIMADCDDTYDLSQLDTFLAELRDGADLVVGNRYAGGIMPDAMTWSHRYLGTPTLTFLLRLLSGARVGDSQCGLRAFSRVAYEKLLLRSDGMEFASEMILKASRLGLRTSEVPTRYYPRTGEAKLETLRDGWRHLRFLLLATPNFLYTWPGAALTILGGLILGLALASPNGAVDFAGVTWRPIFAGSVLSILGLNTLFLAGVANLYSCFAGLTPERGAVFRIAQGALRFERTLLVAGLLLAGGLALEITLAAGAFADTSVPSRSTLAALGQTLILSAGNLGLAGVLASLIRTSSEDGAYSG